MILGVVVVSLITVAVALFLPGGKAPDQFPRLPWKITLNPDGSSSVFGLTLGQTPLGVVRSQFEAEPEINLFAGADGGYAVEAYFQRLFLSGIKADLVMTLAVPPAEAEQMYRRGLRISKLGSGAHKVELAPEDRERILQRPIEQITYLPAADLDSKLLLNLFGKPARRITEDNGISHWLYPEKGLDIALNPDGREVFQYVPPARFQQLLAPLERGR